MRRTKPHSSTNFSEWGANAAEVRRAGTSDTVEGKHCNFELNPLLDRQPVKRVAEEGVAHLIKRLPQKTSPLDCLPVSLLQATVHVMVPLLAQLANISFAAGVFLSRYKLGHVIPLLKKAEHVQE